MKTGRPPAITYEMGGHQFTCRQLAELAGCSHQAMHRRLALGHSPAKAVAWGPADRSRKRPDAKGAPKPGKHEYNGQRYTCAQLAEIAGCSWMAMRSRLRIMDPVQAVARGASDPHRKRKADEERKTPIRVKVEKPPKPAPVKTRPASSDALSASDWRAAEVKKDKRKLPASLKVSAPSGPIVMLPGVEIQRAAPIPDRFAVDPRTCPPIFSGRPYGQYEDTGSAVAKRYGGGGA